MSIPYLVRMKVSFIGGNKKVRWYAVQKKLQERGGKTEEDVARIVAERAGFRPCLQCRPELAPGTAPVDAAASLARRAAGFLEENCGDMESLEELAAHLGCTGRHLRRAFAAEFNVSPIQYLQTLRLLLAKNLLTSTRLSVLDVAMSAGFGSMRRFNELFKKEYRHSPAA